MAPEDDKEVIEKLIDLLENDRTITDGIANGTVKVRFGYELVSEFKSEGDDIPESHLRLSIRPYLHIN